MDSEKNPLHLHALGVPDAFKPEQPETLVIVFLPPCQTCPTVVFFVAFLARTVQSSQSRGQAGRGDALLRTDKFLQHFLEPGSCSDWQTSTAKLGRDTALVKCIASKCSRENWVKIF